MTDTGIENGIENGICDNKCIFLEVFHAAQN